MFRRFNKNSSAPTLQDKPRFFAVAALMLFFVLVMASMGANSNGSVVPNKAGFTIRHGDHSRALSAVQDLYKEEIIRNSEEVPLPHRQLIFTWIWDFLNLFDIFNIIPDRLRNVGESCDGDSQCANNACGKKGGCVLFCDVCCESGATVEGPVTGTQYCSNLAVGDSCDIDAACTSGACGREDGRKVCCAGGDVSYGFLPVSYCTGQPEGAECGGDLVCTDGNCVDGTCCAACTKVVGDTCSNDGQCANNLCGKPEYNSFSSRKECCASGTPTILIDSNPHCTDLPAGATCGFLFASYDSLCASGSCVSNKCT